MTVAYDAVSNATEGTSTLSWTHTPAGTPRGVIVFVVQNAGATDEVTGITYGGVALTEATGSPLLKAAAEDGGVYCYHLGTSIPTGAQTVVVNVDATGTTKAAVAFTVTAAADTNVQDTTTISSDAATNPSATLSLVGSTCFCAEAFMSGQASVSAISPPTDWTSRYEFDFTAQTAGFYTYDTIGSTDVAMGWTQTSDDAICIGVAITEGAAAAAAATNSDGLTTVNYEVWLLDPFGNLLDVIDEWLYLKYDRALNNVGSLELGLDGGYPHFDFIKLDGRIVVWRNGKIDMETSWLIRRIIKTLAGIRFHAEVG